MNQELILPKTLKKVIFPVLPLNGFFFSSTSLNGAGIKAARRIGKKISRDSKIDGGIQIFSSETGIFSSFAEILASHCESKWWDPVSPHLTIKAEIMRPLTLDTIVGKDARRKFLKELIPQSSGLNSVECLILVVSEAQSLLFPQTFCNMTGISCEKNNSAPGALNYRSITMDITEMKMSYDLIDEDCI